jgi:hypothetical protein
MAHAGTAESSSQRQSAADWYIPVLRLLSHDVMDVCPRETALVGTAIALNTLAWQTLLAVRPRGLVVVRPTRVGYDDG